MWLGDGRKEGRKMLCKEKRGGTEERKVKRKRKVKQAWKGDKKKKNVQNGDSE